MLVPATLLRVVDDAVVSSPPQQSNPIQLVQWLVGTLVVAAQPLLVEESGAGTTPAASAGILARVCGHTILRVRAPVGGA